MLTSTAFNQPIANSEPSRYDLRLSLFGSKQRRRSLRSACRWRWQSSERKTRTRSRGFSACQSLLERPAIVARRQESRQQNTAVERTVWVKSAHLPCNRRCPERLQGFNINRQSVCPDGIPMPSGAESRIQHITQSFADARPAASRSQPWARKR